MNKSILVLVFFVILTSCVPHKKLVYFQGEPLKKEDIYKINDAPYKIQTNDVLSITLKSKNEELVALFSNNSSSSSSGNSQNITAENLYFTGYTIDEHGNIRLPYVGNLNVLGYTIDEVREKVKTELKRYIVFDKNIFVTVKLSGVRYTILGDISKPGTSVIYQNKVNIIEAIANSGDIIVTGDRTKVEVIRNEFDGLKKYTIDITQVEMFDSEVFNILPHDIIYINPIKTKSWGIGTTGLQTFTTLASIFSIIATTILLIQTF
tara:strand:- start:21423 stop:22214 length:792 start_codon:yes stop_codon:yes gene_type:complete